MSYTKAKLADGLSSIDIVKDDEDDSWFFRKLEKQNIKLNRNQIEAVRHYENPLQVLSIAGSGKTQILTNRCSYLISVKNVSPEEILMITYTSKASLEMKERIVTTVGDKKIAKKLTIGTFHSIFLAVLREFGNDERTVWGSSDAHKKTISIILRKHKLDKDYKSEDVLARIFGYKNDGVCLEEAPEKNEKQREFKLLWREYEKYKTDNNFMDFGDMLTDTYRLLKTNSDVLNHLRNRWKFILMDESQDTPTILFEIVYMLGKEHRNIMITGDDDQVIFSFSGAKSENILNFSKQFPDATTIVLDINYRSTDTIVGLGDSIIQENLKRIKKTPHSVKPSNEYPTFKIHESPEDEARDIVQKIKDSVRNETNTYKDYAILFRSNSNSRAVFDELLLNNIPFTTFGTKESFYNNSLVIPLLSCFRLALDPYNFGAMKEILPTLYMNAKDKMEYIGLEQRKNPIARPFEHILSSAGLKEWQRKKLGEKLFLISTLSNYKPIVAIKKLREDYEKYVIGEENETTSTLHREIVVETIDELEAASKKFDTAREFIGFVDKIISRLKDQKESKKKEEYNSVRLMSIHKSKGLEFPITHILSVNEGVLPHRSSFEQCTDVINITDIVESISEERRLFYVAVTRAKEQLCVNYLRTHRNKEVKPSRFILNYI